MQPKKRDVTNPADGIASLSVRSDFYENSTLKSLQMRALAYLRAGIPVHLRGPAGVGKTTLAIQIAALLGRQTVVVTGDAMLNSADLIGEDTGTRTKHVVDRYVQSVKRVETETETVWTDNILTQAVLSGHTLVYDEFTRSPPSANNPLLSAFEERLLVVGTGARTERYVEAHPEFRAILTSNPQDYAGVNAPQDALIDRMVTFDLKHHSRETEIGIVTNAAKCADQTAARVVDLVQAMRLSPNVEQPITMRAAIMIARVSEAEGFEPVHSDPCFVQLCFDVLQSKAPNTLHGRPQRDLFLEELSKAIRAYCPTVSAEASSTSKRLPTSNVAPAKSPATHSASGAGSVKSALVASPER